MSQYKPTREWLIENGFTETFNSSELLGERNGWKGDWHKKGGKNYWEHYEYNYGPVCYREGSMGWFIYADEGYCKLNLKSAVEVSNFIYHCAPFIQD